MIVPTPTYRRVSEYNYIFFIFSSPLLKQYPQIETSDLRVLLFPGQAGRRVPAPNYETESAFVIVRRVKTARIESAANYHLWG
jgi:hypothetical protein